MSNNENVAGGETNKRILVVNKEQKEWDSQFITGAEIKVLAGSPADWVVNEKVPGGGEDPEIGDTQQADLDNTPSGGKARFTTRKPTTSPGQ